MPGAAGPQFSGYPGTSRNPQGRLLKPGYSGDPHALNPSQWMTPSPGPRNTVPRDSQSILAWHTNSGDLPAMEDPMRNWDSRLRQDPRFSEDAAGRPVHRDLGSQIGMHFGTIEAGQGRMVKDDVAHPVRFDRSQVPNKSGTKDAKIYSDKEANFSDRLTDKVEEGKVIPYVNDYEDAGSISYRAQRDSVRTWSEDVLGAHDTAKRTGVGAPHPAYVHVAQKGYNPAVEVSREKNKIDNFVRNTKELPFTEGPHVQGWKRAMDMEEGVMSGQQWKWRKAQGAM